MFDLSQIIFIQTDKERLGRNYSFVGLQRNETNGRLEFWLPLGFDDFDETNFDLVKDFFFKMYKTFKVYLKKKQNKLDKTSDRDGLIEQKNGFSFTNQNYEQTVFYGKLNALDKILEGYDELRIRSLEKREMKSHEIDYSKIYKYMHQAIYLHDDVIYIDEMNIAKNILVNESPPILQIFCFIYAEIKRELGEVNEISDKAVELSEQFKENYLPPNSSLFAEDTFSEIIDILKETLENIGIQTAYKDEDFIHFFEAVESFLYGERIEDNEDIYWGFSGFYDIWEDMCQTYVLNNPNYRQKIIYADIEGELICLTDKYPINPFHLNLNNFKKVRSLRPDLVLRSQEDKAEKIYNETLRTMPDGKPVFQVTLQWQKSYQLENGEAIRNKYNELINKELSEVIKYEVKGSYKPKFMYEEQFRKFEMFCNQNVKIIDYKYMPLWDYERYYPEYNNVKNKIKDDIQKQLIYEWSIQKNWNTKTESEFWIPYFSSDSSKLESKVTINNSHFNKSQIKLVKINFKVLQDFYIQQN